MSEDQVKVTIKHRFLNNEISSDTEYLIVGTFNPEAADNPATFFYGRPKNYLWTLLPRAFGQACLKESAKAEKLEFIRAFKINFIDLIEEVGVPQGREGVYADAFLDKQNGIVWRDIISEIANLPLKKVFLTRKTFNDVKNIKRQVDTLDAYLKTKEFQLHYLPTPARFYNTEKQATWNSAFQS